MSIISGAKPGVIANYGACQVKIGNKSVKSLTSRSFPMAVRTGRSQRTEDPHPLVQLHQERNLDFVLFTFSFGATRRIRQRCGESALYCVTKAAGCHRASPHVADRAVRIDSSEDGALDPINAGFVHVTHRRRVRTTWLRQRTDA